MVILEECCMASADTHAVAVYSGEQIEARGPCVPNILKTQI